MIYSNQIQALNALENYAKHDNHSILIEGLEGCGKTWCAKQFGSIKHISDFYVIDPNVNDLRDTIDTCYKINNDIVICIENLDTGVRGASYSILKFLEEPMSNVYIIVTCRNRYKVPETILSRSVLATVSMPTAGNLKTFLATLQLPTHNYILNSPIWRSVKTFKDVIMLSKLSMEKLSYLTKLSQLVITNQPISDLVWQLTHFPDNSEIPIKLVIDMFIHNSNSPHIVKSGIDALRDITSGRVASHTALTKFLFDYKYTE